MANAEQKYIDAAQAVADRGERVTLAAVRREAGGGSMSTITEAVRRWREAQAEQAPQAEAAAIPEEVHEASARALAVVWAQAQAVHRAALDAEREALDAERRRMEAERAEALDLAREVEAEGEQMRQELAAAKAEIAELRAEIADLARREAQARTQADERAERIRAAEARAAEAEERERRASAEAAELRGRLASFSQPR